MPASRPTLNKHVGKAGYLKNPDIHQSASDSPQQGHYPYPNSHHQPPHHHPHHHYHHHYPSQSQGDALPMQAPISVGDHLRKDSRSEQSSDSPNDFPTNPKLLKKMSNEMTRRLDSRSDRSYSPASTIQLLEERGTLPTAGSDVSGGLESKPEDTKSWLNTRASRASLPKLEGGVTSRQFKR
ncbi:homeobox protein MOX-2-like [Acanthaster planci]|uniref:Homeobox protein MOX-2-like n=1 Tax=Acanthaster planci TaxID=133434 RepID=A0A8B7Z1Q5_ACAPL|nr:homeobox protein MOX-2-like [Acanthaster planci]